MVNTIDNNRTYQQYLRPQFLIIALLLRNPLNVWITVMDRGFPSQGRRPSGGCQPSILAIFRKIHEIEKIWSVGGRPLGPTLDILFKATVNVVYGILFWCSILFWSAQLYSLLECDGDRDLLMKLGRIIVYWKKSYYFHESESNYITPMGVIRGNKIFSGRNIPNEKFTSIVTRTIWWRIISERAISKKERMVECKVNVPY